MKKIVINILTIAMCLCLCACNQNNGDENTGYNGNN